MDRANSICWDKPRTATAIKFNDEGANNPQVKTDTNFTRHDTPHPRDLKARHQKLLQERQKSDDSERSGSMSGGQAPLTGNSGGTVASSVSTTSVTANGEKPTKPQPPPRTFPRPPPVATPSSDTTSETDSVIVRSEPEVSKTQKMLSQRIAEEALVNRSHLRDSLTRFQDQSSQQQEPSSQSQVITDRVKQIRIGNGVTNNVEVVNVSMSDDDEEEEQTTAIFNDKHVGFIDEEGEAGGGSGDGNLVPNEERQERHEKLHRRDTPHHLKNKRINNPTKSDQDKVASILASNVLSQNSPNSELQVETNHSRHNSSNHSGGDTESLRSVVPVIRISRNDREIVRWSS